MPHPAALPPSPPPPALRRPRGAAVAARAAAVLALLVDTAWARPAEPPRLRVVADEWCPYTCQADTAREGYLVDLVRAVFEPLGYGVDYDVMPWPQVLDHVEDGKADLALGATPQNAVGLRLPARAVGEDESSFAVRRDNPWRYSGPVDLDGITLGVTADYTYAPDIDAWIARHRDDPSRISVATGEAPLEDSLGDLREGRIDAFIENRAVLLHTLVRRSNGAALRLEGRVAGSPIVVGFNPNDPRTAARAAAFDAGIDRLRASGRLAAILASYGLEDWEPPR